MTRRKPKRDKLRRLPFANVAPYVEDLNHAALAKAAGVHDSTVLGWRRPDRPEANISETAADRLTIALGIAPDEVWPEWYADVERVCAECGERFVPRSSDPRMKFCKRACRVRNTYARRAKPPPPEPPKRQCENTNCGAWFIPDARHASARFCRRECSQAAWHRTKYQTDAEHRERKLEAARRYHHEAGKRARQRRRQRAAELSAAQPERLTA